jgi:hypothetical protein
MSDTEPSLHPDQVFDPEATAALALAYERAVGELHADRQPEFVREIIAKGIIAAAMRGERDPDRLCKSALASIGFRAETEASYPRLLDPPSTSD